MGMARPRFLRLKSTRDLEARVELAQMQGRHLHRLQGATHVVAEHPKQEVPRLIHLRAEMPDGLGQRLIDGLVEANDVLQWRVGGQARVHPHYEDAGAQRSVLGSQLLNVVTASRPQDGVGLGRGLPCRERGGGESHRFGDLRLPGLRYRQVRSDRLQNLLRMIPEL